MITLSKSEKEVAHKSKIGFKPKKVPLLATYNFLYVHFYFLKYYCDCVPTKGALKIIVQNRKKEGIHNT